jgi:hypothetical protein
MNTAPEKWMMEVHRLGAGWRDHNQPLQPYRDFAYGFRLVREPYKVDTAKNIVDNLIAMEKININDPKAPPMLALILYRYTESAKLKKVIREKKLQNIPEGFIYIDKTMPFIVTPLLQFSLLMQQSNYTRKWTRKDFQINVWYTDRVIYDALMESIHDKGRTVRDFLVEYENNDDNEYPFADRLYRKFLREHPRHFPHTIRQVGILLMDMLWIYIHNYLVQMAERYEMEKYMDVKDQIFSHNPKDVIEFVHEMYYTYFHNAKVSQSIFHVHFRIGQQSIVNTHIFGRYVDNIEAYRYSIDLDKIYQYLVGKYPTNALAFTEYGYKKFIPREIDRYLEKRPLALQAFTHGWSLNEAENTWGI